MRQLRLYTIKCDGWWNGEVCRYGAVFETGKIGSGAEKEARAEGWRLIGTGDFCPECVAEHRNK